MLHWYRLSVKGSPVWELFQMITSTKINISISNKPWLGITDVCLIPRIYSSTFAFSDIAKCILIFVLIKHTFNNFNDQILYTSNHINKLPFTLI